MVLSIVTGAFYCRLLAYDIFTSTSSIVTPAGKKIGISSVSPVCIGTQHNQYVDKCRKQTRRVL